MHRASSTKSPTARGSPWSLPLRGKGRERCPYEPLRGPTTASSISHARQLYRAHQRGGHWPPRGKHDLRQRSLLVGFVDFRHSLTQAPGWKPASALRPFGVGGGTEEDLGEPSGATWHTTSHQVNRGRGRAIPTAVVARSPHSRSGRQAPPPFHLEATGTFYFPSQVTAEACCPGQLS